MAKGRRKKAEHLDATVRIHAGHDPEQNARIMRACVQQRAVTNRTIEQLLEHRSNEPLQGSRAQNITGLYGLWPSWRSESTALAEVPSLVARGAIAAAADQVAKWEATNHEHAVLIAKAAESGKPIPRRVQKRDADPDRLWRRRKTEEREGRHRCRIDEKVRRVDRRTLRVPGIGEIRTKDDIPEDLDIRSCVILERTSAVNRKLKLQPEQRSFKIHVSGRKPKPPVKSPEAPGRTIGVEHGIVHAMIAVDEADTVELFDHDLAAARKAHARVTKLSRRMARCKRGSRTWQRRRQTKGSIRRNLDNGRRHWRRSWANHLVHANDTVCVEKLSARNMVRSARGTNEAPGTNVKAKRGLSRSLLGVAPAEQTAILQRTGERTGTRVWLVPAPGTSQTCNACSYRSRENRKSQAVFRCKRCGHHDNADVNASKNVRDNGITDIRARMDESRSAATQPPTGADAGRKIDAQETSGAPETPRPPERAPDPGGNRGSSTPAIAPSAQESRPQGGTQDSWPNGQLT